MKWWMGCIVDGMVDVFSTWNLLIIILIILFIIITLAIFLNRRKREKEKEEEALDGEIEKPPEEILAEAIRQDAQASPSVAKSTQELPAPAGEQTSTPKEIPQDVQRPLLPPLEPNETNFNEEKVKSEGSEDTKVDKSSSPENENKDDPESSTNQQNGEEQTHERSSSSNTKSLIQGSVEEIKEKKVENEIPFESKIE